MLSKQSSSPIEAKGSVRINLTEPDTCASIPVYGLRSALLRPGLSDKFDPI
jgi:hypothetical protein